MLKPTHSLVPKNPDGPLRVIAIGRISTDNQNEESIDASYAYIEKYLEQIYTGPIEFTCLGETASGMLAERATIRRAEDLISTGTFDLIIAEDLSRIFRNPRHQYAFVQDVKDSGTRLITIADGLDTADEERWQIMLATATLRHGLFVADTQRRVRRSAKYAFHRGQMVQRVRFGYRKLTPEEADSGQFGPKGLRMAKIPELTPVIKEMISRFLSHRNYASVADWLESMGIKPGPAVRSQHWSGRLVADYFRDPILSGTRTYGNTICDMILRTGKKRSRRCDSPESEFYPELAHVSLEEQQELWRVMGAHVATHQPKRGQVHPRQGVPRARSLWPGQHARCAVCGGLMYNFGNYLKCENAHKRNRDPCWNHVQVSCGMLRRKMVGWLISQLRADGRSWEVFLDVALSEATRVRKELLRVNGGLDYEIDALEKEALNLTKAIREGAGLERLVKELTKLEGVLKQKRSEQREMTLRDSQSASGWTTIQLDAHSAQLLTLLMNESFDLADLLRRAFPEFKVQPIQAIDSGLVRPRATLTFRPGDCRRAMEDGGGNAETNSMQITVDLFAPPVHIKHLPSCLRERSSHPSWSLKRIAAHLGINHMTVKRAFDVARRMHAESLSEPYRLLSAPPIKASRWRRRL